jgi:peptide/nickel transport system substrate-binding protein
VERLAKSNNNLVAKVYPYTQVFMLQMPSYVPALQNEHVRRAMQLAIDKQALSRAFFANTAKPISVLALPGTPAYVNDFDVKFDKKAAMAELAQAGYGPDKPLEIPFMSANGSTPGDYDMARAIVQMWSQIGIKADLQEVTLAKYLDLNHSAKLPGPMLYSWDNATGDPEIFAGMILSPNLPFSAWKQPELTDTFKQLASLGQDQRIAGYRDVEKKATENAWSIPLLQSVSTIAYKKSLNLNTYQTGYIMPQEYSWKQ